MNNLLNSYYSRRRCKGPRLYCRLFARVSSFQHWPDQLQEYGSEYILLGGRRDQSGSCRRGVWERVTVWELEFCEKLTMLMTTKHENDVQLRSHTKSMETKAWIRSLVMDGYLNIILRKLICVNEVYYKTRKRELEGGRDNVITDGKKTYKSDPPGAPASK